jgi:hypothetical protein
LTKPQEEDGRGSVFLTIRKTGDKSFTFFVRTVSPDNKRYSCRSCFMTFGKEHKLPRRKLAAQTQANEKVSCDGVGSL